VTYNQDIRKPIGFFIFCRVLKCNLKSLLKILMGCPKIYIYNEGLEVSRGLKIRFSEIITFSVKLFFLGEHKIIKKVVSIVFIIGLLLSLTTTQVYALDYPHNDINNYSCASCHYVYGSESSLLLEGLNYGQNIDDTQYNALCWQCHNDIKAPLVNTHSSLQTDNRYGDWTVECRVCHNPHYQKQVRTYGAESFIFSDISSAIQIDMPEAGQSLLTMTGAGWTENEHQGLIVMPNVDQNYYYKILSNTDDTLTIEGIVDLSKVNPAVDTFAITYGKLVKNTVDLEDITVTPQKSGNSTVKLFQSSGANSFADGDSTYDGVCEICHTQTAFHRNNDSGNHSHMILGDQKCTDCHNHTNGFKGSGCDVCHGYPPVVDTPGGPDGLVDDPGVTGSTTAGVHDKHVNTKTYICESCHYNSAGSGPTHNNGLNISIGFSLFNGAYLGGIYDGQTTANYDNSEANTTVINTGSMSCNNIYCHGRLPNGTVWGGGKDTIPTWDGSVTCTSCHDSGGSLSDLGYKHRQHTDESRHGFHCEKCHDQTATGSTAIKNESYHANNVKDVIFSAGGNLDTGTKSCTNTYCHSDARGGAPNVPVKWTDSFSMECDSCHNGRTTLDTLEMSTNGHERLISSQWVRKYPCYYCHDATVNTLSNIKDYSMHVNETKDVVFASKWHIPGYPAPSYNDGTKICDNIYCHSDGTTVNPEVRPFPWTNGHAKCNSCHGHPIGDCTDCHIDDGITGWNPGEEWKSAMPMYENTGAGTDRANTHERHLLTDYNCSKCHANTIAAGNCSDCHIDEIPSGETR
jgi:predicted CxxxxCH...CXXCH cytochrome family protein